MTTAKAKTGDRFVVTVYAQGGYHEILAIQHAIRDLKDIEIDTGITQGGLSVSGPWSSYVAFDAVVDSFPLATHRSGSSIDRH